MRALSTFLLVSLALAAPVVTINPHAQVRLDFKGSAANNVTQDTLRIQPNGALNTRWRPLAIYPGSGDSTPTTAFSSTGRLGVGTLPETTGVGSEIVSKADADNVRGLAIAPHSGTQTANLLEMRDSGGGATWFIGSDSVMNGGAKPSKNFLVIITKGNLVATPSSAMNVAGAAVTVSPAAGYKGFQLPRYVGVLSGGTFAGETLTATVDFHTSDGSQLLTNITFVAAAVETEMTGLQIYNSLLDGVGITSISMTCKSTINNSTATAALKVIAADT